MTYSSITVLNAVTNRRTCSMQTLAARVFPMALSLGLLTACASAPPPSGVNLTSYAGLERIKARGAQASARVDSAPLLTARTVRLEPVKFSGEAQSNATPAQRSLIANAMERALCKDLSSRFEILSAPEKADLTVRTEVTRIKPTNAGVAALSLAVSMVVPAPRLPVGLGGFAAEAEALGPDGKQAAAIVWSRDADVFSGRRASPIGDAYDLSTKFAHDLSKLLVAERDLAAPKRSHSRTPASSACAVYGKGAGFSGVVAGLLGAPPQWTDGKRPSL